MSESGRGLHRSLCTWYNGRPILNMCTIHSALGNIKCASLFFYILAAVFSLLCVQQCAKESVHASHDEHSLRRMD
eukprot:5345811-Amphidinium_carterae.2